MKKKARRTVALITSFAVMLAMIPTFAFAGTSTEKTADGDYHYLAIGDSITAGFGPAYDADTEFATKVNKSGVAIYVFGAFTEACPKDCYVYLLAEKLNNLVNSTPETTVNFKRDENCKWVKNDSDNEFSFTNGGFIGVNSDSLKNMLYFDTQSSEKEGTDEYYTDLFDKNFLDADGKFTSKAPIFMWKTYPFLYAADDGSMSKVKIARTFCEAHEKYLKELGTADITTIAVGSNDLLVNEATDVYEILGDDESGLGGKLIRVLGGYDVDLSDVDLSKLDSQTLIDLIQFVEPSAMKESISKYIESGIGDYETILEKVVEEEQDTDCIALLNLYHPYGTSTEIGGKKYSMPVIAGDILDSLVTLTESDEYKKLEDDNSTVSDTSNELEQVIINLITSLIKKETGIELKDLSADITHFKSIIKQFQGESAEYKALAGKILKNARKYYTAVKSAKNANGAQKKLLLKMLMKEVRQPLMYALAGVASNDGIEEYNEGIRTLAEKYDLKYVDISELATDDDPDVHPGIEGHKWISEKVFAELKDSVPPIIRASDMKSVKASAGKGKLTVNYSAVDEENVTGYNIQYRMCGNSNWKNVKNTSKTAKKITGLKKGKKYIVRVRAYNRNSFETVYGKWKNAKKVKVR